MCVCVGAVRCCPLVPAWRGWVLQLLFALTANKILNASNHIKRQLGRVECSFASLIDELLGCHHYDII